MLIISDEAPLSILLDVFKMCLFLVAESTTPHIQLDTVVTGDVEITLKRTKPSARTLSVKYAAWAHEYESV